MELLAESSPGDVELRRDSGQGKDAGGKKDKLGRTVKLNS